jgi:hypothetical protein
MYTKVQKLLSCIFLLANTSVFAADVPITISGKIVNTDGWPVKNVRMGPQISGSTTSESRSGFPGALPGLPGPTPISMSKLFPGIPAACIETAISEAKTNSRGVFQFRAKFKPDVHFSYIERNRTCAEYQRILTRESMNLKPHPDDVRRYNLEIAYGALPQPNRIKGPVSRQINKAPGGFAPKINR